MIERTDRRQFLKGALAAAATGAAASGARAQAEAVDTLRMLVGFPAGGTTDAVARRIADALRPGYARSTVVENKPGAGGRLAVEELKRSAADGSVMLLTPASMITLYPHLYARLAYRPEDVQPVSTACTSVFGFGVGPAVPASVRTLKQFVAWAKANPQGAHYGSPGAGTPPHFIGALLGKDAGVDLRHVPYRGSIPGVQELLGGQLSAMSTPLGDFLPHVKAGKLRLLATSGPQRSRFAPDVPTFAEEGLGDCTVVEWYGLMFPAGTSAALTNRAAAAVRAAVATAEMGEAFAQFGLETASSTPAALGQAITAERARWAPIVKRVGFTPEA